MHQAVKAGSMGRTQVLLGVAASLLLGALANDVEPETEYIAEAKVSGPVCSTVE